MEDPTTPPYLLLFMYSGGRTIDHEPMASNNSAIQDELQMFSW